MGTDQRLSVQQVHELAPDARAVAAAKRLARPGPWSETGSSDRLLWGRCQGSGPTPYQVTVDLAGAAVSCTCPSRKQPCKHGLALLLLHATGRLDDAATPPDQATEWAQRRADRAVEARAAAAERAAPVDPVAQARRLEARLALMTDGLHEFDRWLVDLLRDGLAQARHRPYAWWDATAARLVDSQVPALAERVRSMPGRMARTDRWPDLLLAEAGRWYVATCAWPRRADLHPDDAADLRTYLGWARSADEVIAGQRTRDRWQVLGVHTTDAGRVTEQRTWLHGTTTGEVVVLLDFAGAGMTLATPQLVGTVTDTDVAVYPGRPPRRVRFVAEPVATDRATALPSARPWREALADVSRLAAQAPWQDRFPATVADARLVQQGDDVVAVDAAGDALPATDVDLWRAVALTGGRPAAIFGEVEPGGPDGPRFRPLSADAPEGLVAL